MSTYISGGLSLVLIVLVLGLGLQIADMYRTTRAVDAALQFAEMEMGMQGCVSGRAVALVQDHLQREGLNLNYLTWDGSPRPGETRAGWGGDVQLKIRYAEPRELLGHFTTQDLTLVIERQVTTISGWVGPEKDRRCPTL